jgi:hypothetical protein
VLPLEPELELVLLLGEDDVERGTVRSTCWFLSGGVRATHISVPAS